MIKNLSFANKFYAMKKVAIFSVISVGLSLTAMMLLGGCLQDKCQSTTEYTMFEPVYKLPEEMRQPIQTEGPRSLESPGKIYYYQDYLFINELRKGIHIIDNRNPASPVPISFINIPGNIDMAVRQNILYADNYVDLVALDITTPTNPVFLSRTESVFPNAFWRDPVRGYIVEYRETPVTEVKPCDQVSDIWFWRGGNIFIDQVAFDRASPGSFVNSSAGGSIAPAAVGIGGSMARFTIAAGQYMYTVDENNLRVFNLAQGASPSLDAVVPIGWGIETIFPLGQNLFIGANNGMYIYSISNPLQPVQLSRFQHAQACDPVFVSGNVAYVTLRDGNACQNFINQLDVIDVSNLTNPRLLKSYPMHNPHGLSVTDNTLYLCENTQGLKVFDVSNWNAISQHLLSHQKGFTAYDVITLPGKNIAMVIGQNGLRQFDTTDPRNLRLLSVIDINRR